MNPSQSGTKSDRLINWLRTEFSPAQLLKSLNAAVLIALLTVIFAISFSALIFSGKLSWGLLHAISYVLIGDALMVLVFSLFSSYSGTIAIAQDSPGVILSVAIAAIAAGFPKDASESQIFSTALILIVGSTLAVGVLFLVVGAFKLGGFARFLPFPVMGGFLAGTGWLLVRGGVGVTTDLSAGMALLQGSNLIHWLPGLVLGLLMLLAANRWKSGLVAPVFFLGATVLFYSAIGLLGIPLSQLFADGWLIGPFQNQTAWQYPLSARAISQVDFQALIGAIPAAAPALLVSLIALLLHISSLELIVKRDIDIHHELITAGIGNIVAGLGGGLMGFHTISLSSLNQTISKGSRLTGLFVALLVALLTFAGVSLLSYIPRFILGGLVIFIGLEMLQEWIYHVWFTLPKIDVLIIYAILITIATANFMWGIAVGMALTIILFLVSYSKLNIVKLTLSGRTHHSRFTRPPEQAAILEAYGDQLCIFKLQEFIFFGTANQLYERVKQNAQASQVSPIKFLLLDFGQVPGLDSTGLLIFKKMLLYTRDHDITLGISSLNKRTAKQFLAGGFSDQTEGLRFFTDLDHAIEWSEEQLIAAHPPHEALDKTLKDYLMKIVHDEAQIVRLIDYMQRREVHAGETIISQGDEADEVFFIESGQVTALLSTTSDEPLRLETMMGGRMVGEIGFFLNAQRTASVIVDQPGVLYSLTRQALEDMLENDIHAAYTFQTLILHEIGQRVIHLTREVDALQR